MIFPFVYEKERRQNFPHLVLQVVVSSLFFRNCAAEMPYRFGIYEQKTALLKVCKI